MSGEILVVVGDLEARLAITTRQWAQALAEVVSVPIGYVRADPADVLRAIESSAVRANVYHLQPSQLASPVPIAVQYGSDGRPDWPATCAVLPALALLGGPPVRESVALLHTDDPRKLAEDWDPASEVRRGVFEVTGLYAEAGDLPAWLEVTCASARMAAWMAACLVLEGIEARSAGDRFSLPLAPSFTLHEDVRDLVVAVAKAHRQWTARD